MASKQYKYVQKLVVTDYTRFWIGAVVLVLNLIAVLSGIAINGLEQMFAPQFILNWAGLVIGPVLILSNSNFKRKRIQLSAAEKLLGD